MIRQTHHSLKWITKEKKQLLDRIFSDYKEDLQFYIDLIWDKKLPLVKRLSSSQLPINKMQKSHFRDMCYAKASAIIRSGKQHKNNQKPEIKEVTLELGMQMFNIEFQDDGMFFNEFINLATPYKMDKPKKDKNYLSLNVPIKYHKHFRKYQDWKRKNCIFIKKIGSCYHLNLVFEKSAPEIKLSGKTVGIDQGYKKLFITNENQTSKIPFEPIYESIARKVQKSKNFKQALVTRDRLINQEINQLINSDDFRHIIIEDLKNVKHKSKFSKKFNNKLQRWVYAYLVDKLERSCLENGILLSKVDPAYTSQTCSKCGAIHKESRVGERFKCVACGMEMDADLNAAINISCRGTIGNSSPQKFALCK